MAHPHPVSPSPRTFAFAALLLVCFFLSPVPARAQAGTCTGISLGQQANLNGFVPFLSNNLWNQDVTNAAVDPNSSAIIGFIGSNTTLHADFGAGKSSGQTIGIPYDVVSGTAFVKINLKAYANESDPGPMPIPANAEIEGYPNPGSGDRHVLVIDRDNCWLYELYHSYLQKNGSWNADATSVWDLTANDQRPYTWTSADAAGLPIFPGLARYDEVAAGKISHALRFTLPNSQAAFIPPASHWAATSSNSLAAPMGMRIRLKSSFDISTFSPQSQVILAALQHYGMIMADNGSAIFITGDPDDRWNNNDLDGLKSVTASNFEVLLESPLYTQNNIPTGPNPTINNFTASSNSITKGQSVTLSWTITNGGYTIVSPQVGAIRGTSAVVTPAATTTYTLYSTNQYGRTTAKVKVTVQ